MEFSIEDIVRRVKLTNSIIAANIDGVGKVYDCALLTQPRKEIKIIRIDNREKEAIGNIG